MSLAAGVNHYLTRASGNTFFNTSPLDMKKLMGDQDHIKENLFALHPGVFALRPRHLREL